MPTDVSTVPRLYLDTSDLIDIADGLVAENVVAELVDAATDVGAVLLLSPFHALDYCATTDEDTRRRIGDATRRFPRLAMVTSMPQQFERARETQDIELAPITDWYGLLEWMGLSQVLAPVPEALARAIEAERMTKRASKDGARRSEKELRSLFESVAPAMATGDVKAVASAIEQVTGVTADSTAIEGLQQLFDFIREYPELSGPDVLSADGLLRRLFPKENRTLAVTEPGSYCADEIERRRRQDVKRKPKVSDFADTSHVTLIPYVDIATVDRENFAVLTPKLRYLRTIRRARLFETKALAEVATAIREVAGASS